MSNPEYDRTEDNPEFLEQVYIRAALLEKRETLVIGNEETSEPNYYQTAVERLHSSNRHLVLKTIGGVASVSAGAGILVWQAPNIMRSVLDWSTMHSLRP